MSDSAPCPRCGQTIQTNLFDGLPSRFNRAVVSCKACGARIAMPFGTTAAFLFGMFGSAAAAILGLQALFGEDIDPFAAKLFAIPLALAVGMLMGQRSLLRALREGNVTLRS